MIKNNFNYKWSKLFAAKRWDTDGEITLTPIEQQELLDDCERLVRKLSIAPVSLDKHSEAAVCGNCRGYGYTLDENGRRDSSCLKCL